MNKNTFSGAYSSVMSPKILSVNFGKIEVENHGWFKNCIVYGSTAEEWDLSFYGSGINEISIAEVARFIHPDKKYTLCSFSAAEASHFVFSTGMTGEGKANIEIIKFLVRQKKEYSFANTKAAIEIYNLWREKYKVAGFFLTC